MAPCRAQSSSSFIYNHCTLSRRNNLPLSGCIAFDPPLPHCRPSFLQQPTMPPKTPPGGRVMAGATLTPILGLQAAKKAVNLRLWATVQAKANPQAPLRDLRTLVEGRKPATLCCACITSIRTRTQPGIADPLILHASAGLPLVILSSLAYRLVRIAIAAARQDTQRE